MEYEILGFEKWYFKEPILEKLTQKIWRKNVTCQYFWEEKIEISFRSISLLFEGFLLTINCKAVKNNISNNLFGITLEFSSKTKPKMDFISGDHKAGRINGCVSKKRSPSKQNDASSTKNHFWWLFDPEVLGTALWSRGL